MSATDYPCPCCDKETTRDGLLGPACTAKLRAALRSLPELMRELRINYTRQSQAGTGNGGKGSETPLVYDHNSSEVRHTVENTIGTWIRSLMEDYSDTEPAGSSMTEWCAWLLARVHRIRGHVAVEQLYDEILYAVRIARQAIDRPADKEYVGQCDLCQSDLFAPPGTAAAGGEIHCRKCAEIAGPDGYVPIYDVADRRAWMLAKFREGLATAQEILTACPTMYGVPIKSATFYVWVNRGHLEVKAHRPDGAALYSVDTALDLASQAAQRALARKPRERKVTA